MSEPMLKVHYGSKYHRAKCGTRLRMDLIGTKKLSEVTCKRCLLGNGMSIHHPKRKNK